MTTIKLKNGSGAPLAGDLVQGEPALDLTNKRLYTEDSGGTVIEVGTNPGEDVTFADNRKAIFGAGSDLQIYHDGTHSRVDDTGTGKLILRGNDAVEIHKYTGEYMITAAADGAVTLYHDDSSKLATTSTGIDVTGTAVTDGLTSSGNIFLDGSGNPTVINKTSGAGNNPLYRLQADTNYWDLQGTFSNANDELFFMYNGSTKMAITSGGNVGIGTASPVTLKSSTTLQVSGNAKLGDDNGRGLLSLGDISSTGANAGIWRGAAGAYAGTGNYLNLGGYDGITFTTGNADIASQTERLRIDSSGNVGIGTTSPGSYAQLAVDNGGNAYPTWFQNSSSGIDYPNRVISSYATGGQTATMFSFLNATGDVVGTIKSTVTSTSFNTSSDYRLKENVVPLTGATERVKQLNPSRFNFIVDADTTVDGFLAHEVADVVPEAITGTKDGMRDEEYEVTPAVYEDVVIPAVLDEEGNEVEAERTEQQLVTEAVMGTRSVPDYQGIDQSKLVPLLVATIQELEARITALESN